MPPFFIYLLKANIALTLFFLGYRLVLRRLTFYTLNRVFLLFGIFFSALFPFVDVDAFVQRHQRLAGPAAYALDWQALQHMRGAVATWTVWDLLQLVFWLGAAVMTIRLGVQLYALWRLHCTSQESRVQGVPVRQLSSHVAPFSFFKRIYLNPALHDPGELEAILRHEGIHVRQWHSLDVLTGELNHVFYWFNPGARLMKQAIRENLEFITDRSILRQGQDAQAYQYSLLQVSRLHQPLSPLANHFHFSELKKRISMMNMQRSPRASLFKYLLLLPLVMFVTLAFNVSRSGTSGSVKAVRRGDMLHAGMAAHPGPPPEMRRTLRREKQHLRTLFVTLDITHDRQAGALREAKAELRKGLMLVRRAFSGRRTELPAPGRPPSGDRRKVFFVRLDTLPPGPPPPPGSPPPPPAMPPFYIVDGKAQKSGKLPADLNPDDIASISVFKDSSRQIDSLRRLYGSSVGGGAILIFTKPAGTRTLPSGRQQPSRAKQPTGKDLLFMMKPASPAKQLTGVSPQEKDTARPSFIRIRGTTEDHPPLLLVDGVVQKDSSVLQRMDPAEIKSINVLKGSTAVSMYGSRGKNGAILVFTKAGDKKQ
ncbi:M56 family metallopeptidase [Compostibacter hankyongensis]|uniref:TonB-dependent receptor plug domain-containing protein n=1 Tax=Compostibacter hankyongensis TaxID=1007089 RepID=A0ABP8FX32_9BACT